MPRGLRKEPKLNVVPPPQVPTVDLPPTLDWPYSDVSVSEGGKSLALPVQYVPWADTLPRPDLQEAMVREDSPQALRFYEALADPLRAHIPISTLAQQAGIHARELVEMWRRHKQVEALGIAVEGAAAVARDTVEDARSVRVCCVRCDGAGMMQVARKNGLEWVNCWSCDGKGWTRKAGDNKSREWVLRAAAVIKQDSGAAGITINQSFSRVDSVLDDLDRITDKPAVEAKAVSDGDV